MPRKAFILLCFYAASLASLHAQPAARPVVSKRVQLTLEFNVETSDTRRLDLTVLIPKSIAGRQKIRSLMYSHPPTREFEENGSRYANFVFDSPPREILIHIEVDAELYAFDLGRAKPRLEKKETLARYLASEKYLEKDAPAIQAAARDIKGKDDLEVIRNVLAFVNGTMARGPWDRKDRGAVWALEKKRGDCTEFADLFVTLCRARGIPARVCEGYLIHDIKKLDTPKHNWAEAYTARLGWIPVDPFHIFLKHATLDQRRPYLHLTALRHDERLKGFHFWTYRYQGGSVSLSDRFRINRLDDLKE